ncbi:hypothetical protein EFK50_02230 [Nocardioides marmoriginsengisoli]|uniref:DUF3494 domain-containing protein n=1 Tax=Nocardioides marmoriginsengisoli TaxID=661483 RepID=A0A3N0CNB3_9ACTN|nr:choice-of-anchor P family protein [Nocardioides marmoriginsengisoli]RNL64829.1 hypothetical protein EFK50_02230 [Nocardioides marmoriginsengisoli]
MRRLVSVLSATALVATASLAAAAAPVSAATQVWTYSGTAGGTQINALGTMISSGLTATSNLTDSVLPNSNQSGVAGVNVAGLVSVGAVTTGNQAESFAGNGVKMTSSAKIAGINLLNGAIKVDAIESASWVTASNATSTGADLDGGTSTTFARLTIAGKAYPLTLPANTKITIPGLAEVVINESTVTKSVPGKTVRTIGNALHITLLKKQGAAPAGAEIKLNPTQALIVPTGPSDALPVGGFAYGTFIGIGAGDSIKVLAQPTGMVSLPSNGTQGTPYTNEIAGVNIPKIAVVGAVQTSVNASTVPGFADVATGAQLAKINLLGGIIKADAVGVTTHVRKTTGDNVSEAQLNFVNLVIAGKKIPINVKPNTLINVFNVGQVWINQQNVQPGYSSIVGLRIILSTKRFGLPIGADIQVAVSASYVIG